MGQSTIIGAVLGSVAIIGLVVFVLVLIMKKRQKSNTQKHRDRPHPSHKPSASNI